MITSEQTTILNSKLKAHTLSYLLAVYMQLTYVYHLRHLECLVVIFSFLVTLFVVIVLVGAVL